MIPLRALRPDAATPLITKLPHVAYSVCVASTRIFYLAFSDGLDYPALRAIEQMLHCRTEPGLTNRSMLERGLEPIAHEPRQGICILKAGVRPQKWPASPADYVLKLGAAEVQVLACDEYIWVPVEAGSDFSNLLFLCPVSDLSKPATSTKATAFSSNF